MLYIHNLDNHPVAIRVTRLRSLTVYQSCIVASFRRFLFFASFETWVSKEHHIESSDNGNWKAHVAYFKETDGIVMIPAIV